MWKAELQQSLTSIQHAPQPMLLKKRAQEQPLSLMQLAAIGELDKESDNGDQKPNFASVFEYPNDELMNSSTDHMLGNLIHGE